MTPASGQGPGRLRLWLAALLLVAVAAFAVGCGDDDDGGNGNGSAGSGASGDVVAKAEKAVAPYLTPPESIGVEPLSKKPPAGKKIAVLSCQLDVCKEWRDDVVRAAKTIGWDAQSISFDGTPEDTVRKMTQAINANVDGIIINGVGRETYEAVLDDAEAKDIPIVTQSGEVEGEPDGAIISVQGRGEQFDEIAAATANWVIADSGGEASALVLGFPAFPISQRMADTMANTLEENCPDCEFKKLNVQPTDPGTSLPGTIVSEIQRNPNINYVMMQDVAMGAGLAAALREANLLDKVKVVGNNGNMEFAQQVADGDFDAMNAFSQRADAYQAVDALARDAVGDEPTDYPEIAQIFTQETLSDAEVTPDTWGNLPSDLAAQFEEVWKVN